MKYIWLILGFLLIVFVGIQFIPTKLNQSNEISPSDITTVYHVPDTIQNMLETSCYDCHSNNTNYPWYNKGQPVRWLLQRHIEGGKSELNFSEFGSYSKRRQKSKLKAMLGQIKNNDMPLWSYTLIHRNAKLTEKEKSRLIKWINTLRDRL